MGLPPALAHSAAGRGLLRGRGGPFLSRRTHSGKEGPIFDLTAANDDEAKETDAITNDGRRTAASVPHAGPAGLEKSVPQAGPAAFEKSVPQVGPAATKEEGNDNVIETGSSGTGPFLLSPAHPEAPREVMGEPIDSTPTPPIHATAMGTKAAPYSRLDVLEMLRVRASVLSGPSRDHGTWLVIERGIIGAIRSLATGRENIMDEHVTQLIVELEGAGLDITASILIRSPDQRFTFNSFITMVSKASVGQLSRQWAEKGGDVLYIPNQRHSRQDGRQSCISRRSLFPGSMQTASGGSG